MDSRKLTNADLAEIKKRATEAVKVNEYYGNDFSRSYKAVLINGKLEEVSDDGKKVKR